LLFATKDHKPTDPDERARIVSNGGSVKTAGDGGPERVNGELALSRAFGDYGLKPGPKTQKNTYQWNSLVSVEPGIQFFQFDKKYSKKMIVACDGLWDVITNEAAGKRVAKDNYDAKQLVDLAIDEESHDNISLIVAEI
jgi:serine/threonine protein phosphatase PrpC